MIKGLLLNNDPDIRIESAEGMSFLYHDELVSKLDSIPEVVLATPYVSGKALMTYYQKGDRVVNIKGIRPNEYQKLNNLKNNISSGTLNLNVKRKMPGILMSEQMMAELGMHVGDQVILLSAEGMRKSLTQFSMPRSYRFQVRGAYSLTQIVDDAPVYIDIEAAQRLFDYRNRVSGLDVRLTNSDAAESVKDKMSRSLDGQYKISTWYDLEQPLYDVMYLEKWGSYLILMIIVLVAVLNIVGSLSMIVIQKNRDIGVLLTMGYTPSDIRKIFMKQGLYIGLIGCGLGGGVGLLLSWMQQKYGLIKLSSAFIINAYPVSIHFWDVSIILVGSLLLCLAASWYPAKRAATVEPADAVRYE